MEAVPGAQQRSIGPQRVWDAPTRIFHWLLAGLIALSWWTAEEHVMAWHTASGLAIVGLLVFRIYWGFAGPETSRFASFLKGPPATFSYVRSLLGRTHRLAFGHNPVGGLSVAAMLLVLVAHVTLGLFAMDTDGLESGPLSRFVSYDIAEEAGDLHEDTFNVLLVLIGLHISAIAFYLVVKRANLIGPMITGRRKHAATGPETGLAKVPVWRFIAGAALSGAVVWFLVSV